MNTETRRVSAALAVTPDEAVINVRDTHGTYVARAAGLGTVASCTGGKRQAVAACADKVFGLSAYALKEVTGWTWVASRVAYL